jgi:anti-sigma-K factor RskA
MADPDSPVRNWGTIAAFTLIATLTIIEGIDEGFSFWDWLVLAVSAVAILVAVSRVTGSRTHA